MKLLSLNILSTKALKARIATEREEATYMNNRQLAHLLEQNATLASMNKALLKKLGVK